MKLTALLLALYLVTGVVGRNLAGGFERMWFWYIYQADIATFADKYDIAKGCKGKGPHGSCTFNEFIKHINGMTDLPAITDETNPKVIETAKLMDQMGLTESYNDYDPQKVYPIKGVAGIPSLFLKLGEAVKAIKLAWGGDLSHISGLLDGVTEASTAVSDLRNADFNANMLKTLNPKAVAAKFNIQVRTVDIYGESFKAIGVKDTLAAYPNINGLEALLKRWMDDYRNKGPKDAKIHYNILEKLKLARKLQKC